MATSKNPVLLLIEDSEAYLESAKTRDYIANLTIENTRIEFIKPIDVYKFATNNMLNGEYIDEETTPVFFMGSISSNMEMARSKYIPSTLISNRKYNHSEYYHLLSSGINKDYVLAPFSHIKSALDRYKKLGMLVPGKHFFKSNSGLRPMAGFVADTSCDSEIDYSGCGVKDQELIVVAKAKEIRKEVRLFCRGVKILSSVEYFPDVSVDTRIRTIYDIDSNIPSTDFLSISEYLKNSYYGIDPLYVIDVCLDAEKYRWQILELNCFNTSGIYGSDYPQFTVKPILQAASEYALQAHNTMY